MFDKVTAEEHVEWCKERAKEFLDRGEVSEAYASFASDMGEHQDTANHPALGLGLQLMMIGDLSTADKMRTFIEGFN